MKKIILLALSSALAAQVIDPVPGPKDVTSAYSVTTEQSRRLITMRDIYLDKLTRHETAEAVRVRHIYYKECQAIKTSNNLPQTAVCDLERGIIRGKDAQ